MSGFVDTFVISYSSRQMATISARICTTSASIKIVVSILIPPFHLTSYLAFYLAIFTLYIIGFKKRQAIMVKTQPNFKGFTN
jgi:hypothetical protein